MRSCCKQGPTVGEAGQAALQRAKHATQMSDRGFEEQPRQVAGITQVDQPLVSSRTAVSPSLWQLLHTRPALLLGC